MHQIRYFLAVSKTLNFTRAAAECNVAQPSLTRAIKLLEAELGSDLFRRERTFTHLTDFGQRMLPLLGQCYDSAVSAKKLAASIRKGVVVPFTLSVSRAVDLTLLVPPLRELVRVFPNLELRILRGSSSDIAEQLKRGDAILAISGRLADTWDRLDEWRLFEEPFRAFVGPSHRFAGLRSVAFADLGGEKLLSRPYCEKAAAVDQTAQRRGITLMHGHEVAAEEDLMRLVEEDFGIAIVPASTLYAKNVRGIDVDGLDIGRSVVLYGVAGRERPPAATAFMNLLRARDWTPVVAPTNEEDTHPADVDGTRSLA